jgi:hypothetical protein
MIIGISDLLHNLFVTRKKRAQVFLSLFRHLSKSSLLTILVNVLLVAKSETFFLFFILFRRSVISSSSVPQFDLCCFFVCQFGISFCNS